MGSVSAEGGRWVCSYAQVADAYAMTDAMTDAHRCVKQLPDPAHKLGIVGTNSHVILPHNRFVRLLLRGSLAPCCLLHFLCLCLRLPIQCTGPSEEASCFLHVIGEPHSPPAGVNPGELSQEPAALLADPVHHNDAEAAHPLPGRPPRCRAWHSFRQQGAFSIRGPCCGGGQA